MCDPTGATAASGRPRWGRLYAIFPIAVAAFATVELETPASVVRTLLYCLAGIGVSGGIAWWVRSNRAALGQLDWCRCASERVTIRIITSEPRQRPRRMIAERVVAREMERVVAEGSRGVVTAAR